MDFVGPCVFVRVTWQFSRQRLKKTTRGGRSRGGQLARWAWEGWGATRRRSGSTCASSATARSTPGRSRCAAHEWSSYARPVARAVVSATGIVRAREAGKAVFIDFHLVVPAAMTVKDAHDICDRIEAALTDTDSGAIITIHVEPEHKAKHSGIVVL